MNTTGTIIFVLIILVVPLLFIMFYLFIVNRTILKSYKSLNEKYGFEVDASKKSGLYRQPVSKGYYRNIPVLIGSFSKHEGRKKSAATYIEAECTNPDQMEFIIVKRSPANVIRYGEKESAVNDAEFDDKFIVNTNDSEKMNKLMNFSIKYKLLQSLNLGLRGELTLRENKLQYVEKEYIKSSVNLLRIEILLHLLCEMEDELNEIKHDKEF